ncbi:hypothetical protein [uncultured Shewanella sp.]|uniref:hypothetical protein n=1 Tax=uncultured Shewanella sp. TaxID=173975 RepID=UPI002610A43F|nr:hypothetical protein [uncultured Shewanella sp.]
MQRNKLILTAMAIVIPFFANADPTSPDHLAQVMAKYETASIPCGKYSIADFNTKNKWFKTLSEEEKKTVIYYVVSTLKQQCLQPLENELIVAFFYDAAITDSNEKLLTYLDMMKISMPSPALKQKLQANLKKLDMQQIDLIKEELKATL